MKVIDKIAMVILLFGGLNWGMVGVADYNVVMYVFIAMHNLQHFIYILTGLSAIWIIVRYIKASRKKKPFLK